MKPTPWQEPKRERKKLPNGLGQWLTVVVTYQKRNWIPQKHEPDKKIVPEVKYEINIVMTATGLDKALFQQPFRFSTEIAQVEDQMRKFLSKQTGLEVSVETIVETAKSLMGALDKRINPPPRTPKLPTPVEPPGIIVRDPVIIKRCIVTEVWAREINDQFDKKFRITLGTMKTIRPVTTVTTKSTRQTQSSVSFTYHLRVAQISFSTGIELGLIYEQSFHKSVSEIERSLRGFLCKAKHIRLTDEDFIVKLCKKLTTDVMYRFDRPATKQDELWEPPQK